MRSRAEFLEKYGDFFGEFWDFVDTSPMQVGVFPNIDGIRAGLPDFTLFQLQGRMEVKSKDAFIQKLDIAEYIRFDPAWWGELMGARRKLERARDKKNLARIQLRRGGITEERFIKVKNRHRAEKIEIDVLIRDLRDRSRKRSVWTNPKAHIMNSYFGLNQCGSRDRAKRLGLKSPSGRISQFVEPNVVTLKNILIDIDAEPELFPKSALGQIKEVTQAILAFFDRDMVDWKVTLSSKWGNQFIISPESLPITRKNRSAIGNAIEYFHHFLNVVFCPGYVQNSQPVHIDRLSDLSRVARIPYTWNANKGVRARPCPGCNDWTRYEDDEILAIIMEIGDMVNERIEKAEIVNRKKEYRIMLDIKKEIRRN